MCDIICDIISDIIYDIILIVVLPVKDKKRLGKNLSLLIQPHSKLGNFGHGLRWYALTWLIVGKSRKKIEKAKDFVGPKKPANAFLLFCQHRRTAVAEDYLKVRADTSAPSLPPPSGK